MSKILTIAWREFLETVKTRAFFFGVIFMPALIIAAIYGIEKISKYTTEELPARKIAVIDRHGGVLEPLSRQIEVHNKQNPSGVFELLPQPPETDIQGIAEKIRAGELYGYLLIPENAVAGDDAVQFARADNQLAARRTIDNALTNAIRTVRFQTNDPPIQPAVVASLMREVNFATVDVRSGEGGKDDELARVMTPFALMFLIYMGTFGISMGLLTSVLEEKSSRVVEVLLAAVSPTQLMAGKIVGMVGVGLVTMGVWVAVGYASARSYNMTHLFSGPLLIYVVLYFIPGFLFMSSLLAAIGSACNTLKEAQSMSSPLTIINIVPMMLWFPLSQGPNSVLAIALSFVPPITPFVMVLRLCADPDIPLWQVIATLATLWAAAIGAIWVAGKVFRVGILMYGKAPSIGELLRRVQRA